MCPRKQNLLDLCFFVIVLLFWTAVALPTGSAIAQDETELTFQLPEPFAMTLAARRKPMPEPFAMTLAARRKPMPEPFAMTLAARRKPMPEPFAMTLAARRKPMPEPFAMTLAARRKPMAMVVVPDVIGLPAPEAQERIRAAGLDPRPQPAGLAVERDMRPGTVFETVPPRGAEIATGEPVKLIIRGPRPRNVVPDVRGLDPGAAGELISAAGFDPAGPAPAGQGEGGTVAATDPPAGTELDIFSQVTILVTPPASEPPLPNTDGGLESTDAGREDQSAQDCGAKLSKARKQELWDELKQVSNGRWAGKYRENDIRTHDTYNRLRDEIVKGDYFPIQYEINVPVWRARLACFDTCIMGTPRDLQINRTAYQSYRQCMEGCSKIRYARCDGKGRVEVPAEGVPGDLAAPSPVPSPTPPVQPARVMEGGDEGAGRQQTEDPEAQRRIVGQWSWFTGKTVTISEGRMEGPTNRGRWIYLGNDSYRFFWETGGFVDDLTWSPGPPARLEGKNQLGSRVWAIRASE